MNNDKMQEFSRVTLAQRLLDEIATELKVPRKNGAARREAKWRELCVIVNQQMNSFAEATNTPPYDTPTSTYVGHPLPVPAPDLTSQIVCKDDGR